jgi:hypothetical protein
MNGAKDSIQVRKKEKSDDGRGCVQNSESGIGDNLYAVIDHPGYGWQFPASLLGDVRPFVGEDGDGWLFCRLRLFTVH